MKKSILLSTLIVIIIIAFAGCGDKVDEKTVIAGTWQPYATLVDNKIVPYEDTFDSETAKQLMDYTIEFNDKGNVVYKRGNIKLDGTYQVSNGEYIITLPFTDSGDTATFNCKLDEGNLIVKFVLPEGYEDYDPGDPILCYRK